MYKIEIGKLLQNRRNKLSIKHEDLSEITGITSKTIYLVENGKGNPSFDTLQKLFVVVGLEILVQIKKVNE